ncbi:hypothetical protein [Metamycoplasma neophronis]|uniref:Uncharacterized protein n=1 Tax=Metamycoplasma neophronis TaxID=872983 RepID=A0ABY2Z0P2_9BACT|nr:hypothetical protein [Metamycoplasma neophronis]TPR54720.1 hypothetical protein FJR74_00405 [Metamycoplasma neophronis]
MNKKQALKISLITVGALAVPVLLGAGAGIGFATRTTASNIIDKFNDEVAEKYALNFDQIKNETVKTNFSNSVAEVSKNVTTKFNETLTSLEKQFEPVLGKNATTYFVKYTSEVMQKMNSVVTDILSNTLNNYLKGTTVSDGLATMKEYLSGEFLNSFVKGDEKEDNGLVGTITTYANKIKPFVKLSVENALKNNEKTAELKNIDEYVDAIVNYLYGEKGGFATLVSSLKSFDFTTELTSGYNAAYTKLEEMVSALFSGAVAAAEGVELAETETNIKKEDVLKALEPFATSIKTQMKATFDLFKNTLLSLVATLNTLNSN